MSFRICCSNGKTFSFYTCGVDIFYFHPWEIDPDQPRVEGAPLRSRVRHYTNLSKMAGKLRKLASDFSWGRMDEIARIEAQRCVPFVS